MRSRSRRGAFAESWWGRRWTRALEGFGQGPRLERGRRYARGGQVASIDVEPGVVFATVQGSRKRPYEVRIELGELPDMAWEHVAIGLAEDVNLAARLLAGELPDEIEEMLGEAGVSLLPERSNDLVTECSCPDWANPCKHIAAVHYLFAEALDRDPFLLFRLRGMEREDLLERLGDALTWDDDEEVVPGPVNEGGEAPPSAEREERDGPPVAEPEPLPADPAAFWAMGELPPGGEDIDIPTTTAALLRRLGDPPFWRGQAPLFESLEPVYREASEEALELLSGEEG